MIRDRSVFGVDALRRGIEQVETLRSYACHDLGGGAAPGERLAHAEQPARACDGRQDRIGVLNENDNYRSRDDGGSSGEEIDQ